LDARQLSDLGVVAALRVPSQPPAAQQSRRSVLGAIAALSVPAAAHAETSREKIKADMYAKVKVREEADRLAAMPINKLKALRATLVTAPELLESEDFGELRETIGLSGLGLSKLLKTSGFSSAATQKSLELVVQLRKDLLVADQYAYTAQMSNLPTGALSGYCAPGVVPRDGPGSCKPVPTADKAPALASLKAGLATFDEIIKACS